MALTANSTVKQWFIVQAIVLLFGRAAAFNPYDDSAVLTLSAENFTEVLAKEQRLMVEFYAPWCSYCQRLLPEYNAAAKTLKGRIPLAKIDGTEYPDLMKQYGIEGYPALLWFEDAKETARYPGTPSFERELVEWIDKRTRPVVEKVSEPPTWYAIGKPNVVLYAKEHPEGATASIALTYEKMATKYGDKAYFFHIVSAEDTKVVYSAKAGKEQEWSIGKDPDKKEMIKFIKTSWNVNNVVALHQGNFQNVIKSNRYVLVAFIDPSCPHCKALHPEYKKAAAALKGEPFVLARVDVSKDYGVTRDFEIDGYPTLLWFVNGEMAQKYNGRRSMGGLVEWVHEQVLPPVRRASDPLPEPLSKPQFALYAPELSEKFENFADKNRAKAAFFYVKSDEKRVSMRHVGEKDAAQESGDVDWAKFLQEHQLPEFERFSGDFFELCKVANVGVIRVFYLADEKENFETRIDPVIRSAKRSLGKVGAKYCWTSVDMDDPNVKLNCHKFPCIQATTDTSVAGGTRYVFGDYDKEEWNTENIKDFILDIEKGKAEGVQQGEQRKKGPKYTKKAKKSDHSEL